jgi:RND family efflux transporter MFP subunit
MHVRPAWIIATLVTTVTLAGFAGGALAQAPAGPTSAPVGIRAFTAPSQEATLSMGIRNAARIAKIPIKEGQAVKAGDLLVQLDDQAEQLNLRKLKAQADDQVQIKAAQAQLDQKKVDLVRTVQAFQNSGAATDLEVQHAKLEVTIAELSLELAGFKSQQDQLAYQETQAEVERMKMLAPFDGVVEKLAVHEGESVEPAKPILRLVRIQKLWIDVPVPCEIACDLQLGQEAKVVYRINQEPAGTGKIIHLASVAESASNTRLVRLELENSAGKPAGLHVIVAFAPAKPAEASTSQPAPPDQKGTVNVSQGK